MKPKKILKKIRNMFDKIEDIKNLPSSPERHGRMCTYVDKLSILAYNLDEEINKFSVELDDYIKRGLEGEEYSDESPIGSFDGRPLDCRLGLRR